MNLIKFLDWGNNIVKKVLLIFILCLFSLNLFSKDFTLTKEEIDYLKNNPTINLGYSTNFEPIYMEKYDGTVEGIAPDLYDIVSTKLGVKINHTTNTWKRTIENTVNGDIDVIPMMSPKTAKNNGLLVSDDILFHIFRVFAKKDAQYKIDSMKDLEGLRIAYVNNIIVLDDYLQQYKDKATLVKAKSSFDAFEKVLNNKADIAIVFNISGQYLIKKNFLTQLEPLYFLDDFKIATASAITPSKHILHSILTKTLNSISYEDKLNIIKKWTELEEYSPTKFDSLLTAEEKAYLKETKTIKVHVEKDWAPYNFINNGEIKGFTNDYLKIIGKLLNKEIEFVKGYSWNDYLSMLKNKQIDIISNMAITDQRKKDFAFTNNILFSSYKSIFSNEDQSYTKLSELRNKKVGTVKGYYEEELIGKYYPNMVIKGFDTNTKLIEALLNKEVDAIVGNEIVIDYLLIENFITTISSVRLINNQFPLKSIRMAFNKENKTLKSIIDKAMNVIPKDELNELKDKWTLNIHSHEILSDKEEKYLKNNLFTIYNNKNGWYPFIFKENNSMQGISVDMWNEIVKGANIRAKYQPADSFSKVLQLFKENPNSIITSTSYTKAREKYALFTKPYASFPIAIVTNLREDFLIDLNELESKTVAVGKNYSAHKLLEKYYPKIDFVLVGSTQEALDMLANGKVFAAADILPVVNYSLSKYGFTNLKISGTSKFNFDVQIMVNKEQSQLIPILNKLIDNMDEDRKHVIINKWLHHKNDEIVDYTLAYWILLISLLIIAFMLYRQNVLKKQKTQIEYEIKKATKELIELNSMHEETQHLAKMGTIRKDLINDKYWASKEFYNIFNIPQDNELSIEKILQNVDSEFKNILINFLKKSEEYKGKSVNNDIAIIKLNLNNGISKYIEINLSYIFDENNNPIERQSIVQDVTEKVLAKQEKEKQDIIFMQQSKLASMGEMIGAIAHQWRQPLNELSIRIQKLKYNYAKEQVDEKFIYEFIQKNKKTIDFMSKTIDDFRNFFRIDKEKNDFHIRNAIEEVINIQNAQLKNHNIELEFIGEDFIYSGFKTEFQQVIMNLISNSKDALVSNKINQPKIKIELKNNIITVEDNGGGIKNDIINRVFEPYFTTKEQGDGTGMGLYMSKMIIEDNMHGKINIINNKNGILITIKLKA